MILRGSVLRGPLTLCEIHVHTLAYLSGSVLLYTLTVRLLTRVYDAGVRRAEDILLRCMMPRFPLTFSTLCD